MLLYALEYPLFLLLLVCSVFCFPSSASANVKSEKRDSLFANQVKCLQIEFVYAYSKCLCTICIRVHTHTQTISSSSSSLSISLLTISVALALSEEYVYVLTYGPYSGGMLDCVWVCV